MIPLFFDTPDGEHDLIWIIYLFPIIGVSYHLGRSSGLIAAAVGIFIYNCWELRELIVDHNAYDHHNFMGIVLISAALLLIALLIGTLVKKVSDEKEVGQKKNEYLEEIIHNLASEHVKSKEALQASQEVLIKAFSEIPIPLFIVKCDNGEFLEINKSFEVLTGYTREEIIGHNSEVFKLFLEDKTRLEFNEMIMAKNSASKNFETEFITKNGETRTGLFSFQPLQLCNTMCVLCTCNDTTDLRMFKAEMVRLDRLNLIGIMAAGLGHEIRNPLTTVRGFLQLLGGQNEFAKAKDRFDLMISELDRSNAIITEFLSLAKTKPTELEEYNINEIIERLFPLLDADAMSMDKVIQLNLNPIPNIKVNIKEIRQLILNLVRNGLEAMKTRGVLTVKTYAANNEAILAIQDEGCGISKEILEKLGTPFLSTKDTGTGLGLAVCYGIVERHNATIEVRTGSTGTTFIIKFRCNENNVFQNVANNANLTYDVVS